MLCGTRSLAYSAATLLVALSASAQLATDEIPRQRTISRSEEIRRELKDSRFRLGAIRVRPTFGIRDLGYDNNVFGSTSNQAVSDWRSTISAGANLILPVGSKMYLTGIVAPEYTYYQRLADHRVFGGDYGGSLIMLFNRLSVETGGSFDKSVAPVNSELERSAPGRRTDVFGRSELEIFRRLSLFGSAERQQQRYAATTGGLSPGTALSLDQLERNETFVRGGVRYQLRSYFSASVAVENGRTQFVSARASDNNTHAILLGIHYDRPRMFVNISGGRRTGDPNGPFSTFPSFSTTTGSYYASYALGAPMSVDFYGHRSIVYGLYVQNPYYLEMRNGFGLTIPVGQRIGLRVFSELGANAYPVATPAGVKRTDDVTVLGGGLAYRLYRKAVVTIVASQTRYASNLDTYDRSVFRLATVVSMRGDFFR